MPLTSSSRMVYLGPVIIILTGPVHSGKTSLIQNCLPVWESRMKTLGGFLSLAVMDRGRHAGYDLFDLSSRDRLPFIRKSGRPEWPRVGSYSFRPEIFDLAERLMARGAAMDICIVDEIGPLEMSGGGFWPGLSRVLPSSGAAFILVVRENLLEELAEKGPPGIDRIFHVRDAPDFTRFAAGL